MDKNTFKYKVPKTINLGFEYNENLLKKDELTSFEGLLNNQQFYINISNDDKSIQELGKDILDSIVALKGIFINIFDFDQYNLKNIIILDGAELFYSKEKNKFPKEKNKGHEYYYEIIYNKFEDKFIRFKNEIERLENLLETNEENKNRTVDIYKTINYLRKLLNDLLRFSLHYQYSGYNEKKKNGIEQIKKDNENIENFIKLLNTISKKSVNGELLQRVSLNPAIVNTSGDINRVNFEKRIKEIKENKLPGLEQKVLKLKITKQEFLQGLDKYLNHILYEENFFNQSKNYKYKEKCKEFYHEIESYKSNNNLLDSFDILKDFLSNNPIKKELKNIEYENLLYKCKKQELEIEGNNGFKVQIKNLNFKNLNKLKYKLLWEKKELKDKNENVDKIRNYITEIKGEIRTRIEKDGSLYKDFLDKKRNKSQSYGQLRTEYIQKSNFDFESYGYDSFGLLVKGNDGQFYVYLMEKDKFKEELKKIKESKQGDDLIYHFESITPKGLYKLAFLKNAFDEVDKSKFEYSYKDKYGNNKNKTLKDLYDTKNKINNEELNSLILYFKECILSEQGQKLFGSFTFNFQDKYDKLSDFEKDILKAGYLINSQKIDIIDLNSQRLYKLTLNQDKLTKNKGLDLNILNLFFDGKYEQVRLLPEIKLYYREQSIKKKENEKRGKWKDGTDKVIIIQKRFTIPTIRASFLFEINPLEINKNPEEERKKFFYNIKKDNNLCYYGIDIGESSFAMISRYDKQGNIIPIQDDGEQKQFFDLTNAKIEKGIINIDSKLENDKKYKFLKEFIGQIYEYQINLKEILKEIGTIDIGKDSWKTFPSGLVTLNNDIKYKLKENIEKFIKEKPIDNKLSKKYFKGFSGLTNFLDNFIKKYKADNPNENEMNLSDFYHQIFKELEFFKIVNFKQAFGSNFVGIIKHLIQEKPGIIVFENLWNNKIYEGENLISKQKFENLSSKDRNIMKSFGSYVGNYIFQNIFNALSKVVENGKVKQYVFLDKNITKSLESESLYGNNGIIFWIKAEGTSSICPKCLFNPERIDFNNCDIKNGEIVYKGKSYNINPEAKNLDIIKDKEKIKKMSMFVRGKKACRKNDDVWCPICKKGDNQDLAGNFIYGNIEFKDGDDLASYIIAKNGKEYLENPEKIKIVKDKIQQKNSNMNKNYKNSNNYLNNQEKYKTETGTYNPFKNLLNNKK